MPEVTCVPIIQGRIDYDFREFGLHDAILTWDISLIIVVALRLGP